MVFCDSRTAAVRRVLKAKFAAASTVGPTSAGASARNTLASIASSTFGVARPIGTCHGMNSPHSPRIDTMASSGTRHTAGSDSAFMQLPTPLDCMSKTPLRPPAHAPHNSPTPSSSVVSVTVSMSFAASHRAISGVCPASGTCATSVTRRARRTSKISRCQSMAPWVMAEFSRKEGRGRKTAHPGTTRRRPPARPAARRIVL